MKFHQILDGFSDRMLYLSADNVIFDPEWKEVQEMAKEVTQIPHGSLIARLAKAVGKNHYNFHKVAICNVGGYI